MTSLVVEVDIGGFRTVVFITLSSLLPSSPPSTQLCAMSIPLPSPITLVGLWVFTRTSDETSLVALLVLVAGLVPYFIVTLAHQFTRERIFGHYKSATEEYDRHLPVVKEREGESDSAWASEYSLSIDRYDPFRFHLNYLMLTHCESCIASACLALDALDHNWPWKTAEVRKAVSQADACAAVMNQHSSVSFYPVPRGRSI
jgi:hypothetical protein